MPEAHMFNQSSADISIVFQELPEVDVLPSAPVDVLPAAPEVDMLPSAHEVDVLPSGQQVKVDVSPAKVSSKSLPWVASLIFLPFFWYLCLGEPCGGFHRLQLSKQVQSCHCLFPH